MSDTTTASAESAVRPFRIEVPQGEIDELRRRINATRWPTRETRHHRSRRVCSWRRYRTSRVTGYNAVRLAPVPGVIERAAAV